MAIKKKKPADIRAIFSLHHQASKLRDDLLEEVYQLRIAGKLREARQRLKAAEGIQQRLTALEMEVRLRSPAPKWLLSGQGEG
ncbi:MAG: hypothetical protein ACREVV_16880 [Steroidobacteraceae bacterium]